MVGKLPKYRRGIGIGRHIAPKSGVSAVVTMLPHHITRSNELEMVIIEEVVSLNFSAIIKCQHPNLVTLFDVFKYKKTILVIEYTTTSLERVIAADLILKEINVSTVCSQVRLSTPLIPPLNSADI
jgi:hypothetical protein